jgi:superfamily II DNA or RNA helicase
MDSADRDRFERILRRIPSANWEQFLQRNEGRGLRRRLRAIEEALAGDANGSAYRQRALSIRIASLLGHSAMQDRNLGPWIREQLLRRASRPVWDRVIGAYSALNSRRTVSVRRNASRRGDMPAAIAGHWHQGGHWARTFCEIFDLPDFVWQRRCAARIDDVEIVPSEALPPLHDYQQGAHDRLRALLARRARGRTALLSLPTGAGKTRVVVEAICDHLAEAAGEISGAVLWIAQSAELQLQAWECFREVWQVPPRRADRTVVRRVQPLVLVRIWGGRDPETVPGVSDQPEVIIASVDQLASWVRRRPGAIDGLRERRYACVVIDEAHGVITNEFRAVLEAFGLKTVRRWLPARNAPLLIGMTATPWRAASEQDAALRRFFSHQLVTPQALGRHPVARLQRRGMLSQVVHERIRIPWVPPMTASQRDHVERFHEIPAEYLEQLAGFAARNREIVRRVAKAARTAKTLVFACSIEHAETLATCLDELLGHGSALAVTSTTPRGERALAIERFRAPGALRVLCTVGVLAAGFDAPTVGAVVVTRPTMSAAHYEQMVGRGLRGPLNGGTRKCKVIDVQDEGLPDGILSYERVIARWDAGM